MSKSWISILISILVVDIVKMKQNSHTSFAGMAPLFSGVMWRRPVSGVEWVVKMTKKRRWLGSYANLLDFIPFNRG
jgi:hypothetical protein